MSSDKKDLREYERNPMGHEWQRDEDGDLDIFAYAEGNHNGPRCVNCDEYFCHHCQSLPSGECSKAKS